MTHSFLIVGGTREKRRQRTILLSDGWRGRRASRRAPGPSEAREAVGRDEAAAGPVATKHNKFDATILEPEEDKRTITIEQIRNLQHQLSLKPYLAKHKTGIIHEAQRMTVEAQNALLKTLEEPPAHSVLILTAPSTRSLLPTIVSRCQITRLPPAIDLDLESEEYKKGVEEFLELLQKSRGERLAWVEKNKKAINYQLSTINLLDIWISVLRDLVLLQNDCQNLRLNLRLTSNHYITTILSSMVVTTAVLTDAIEQAQATKKLMATVNVSPRLALEVLLLDLPVLTPKYTS